jgi:enoyl-CoA hydratase/carnithine racemase
MLPRLVGQSRSLDIIFAGRWKDADEGAQIVLANRVLSFLSGGTYM